MEDHLGSDLRYGWRGYPICFWGIGNGNYLSVCFFSVLFTISLNLVHSAPFPHLTATRLNPLSPPPLHEKVEEKSPEKEIKFFSLLFFLVKPKHIYKINFSLNVLRAKPTLGGGGGGWLWNAYFYVAAISAREIKVRFIQTESDWITYHVIPTNTSRVDCLCLRTESFLN